MNVSFPANQRISCVLIDNIIDDNVNENAECFSLVIMVPPDSHLVSGENINVTIISDDIAG